MHIRVSMLAEFEVPDVSNLPIALFVAMASSSSNLEGPNLDRNRAQREYQARRLWDAWQNSDGETPPCVRKKVDKRREQRDRKAAKEEAALREAAREETALQEAAEAAEAVKQKAPPEEACLLYTSDAADE